MRVRQDLDRGRDAGYPAPHMVKILERLEPEIFQLRAIRSRCSRRKNRLAVICNAMFGNIADKPEACPNVARALRRDGRLIVSHPEGRSFVDQLRAAGEIFIESFPTRDEFGRCLMRQVWRSFSIEMTQAFRDGGQENLMVTEWPCPRPKPSAPPVRS